MPRSTKQRQPTNSSIYEGTLEFEGALTSSSVRIRRKPWENKTVRKNKKRRSQPASSSFLEVPEQPVTEAPYEANEEERVDFDIPDWGQDDNDFSYVATPPSNAVPFDAEDIGEPNRESGPKKTWDTIVDVAIHDYMASLQHGMCDNRKCHVQLCGDSIRGMKSERLKEILKECSIVKPLHVIKTEQKDFALIHFKSELDASTFYHVYSIQKKRICNRLEEIEVNPSILNNKPVNYSNFQVQPRISSSSKFMCHCSIALNTNTNNDSTSNTNPSNGNIDTPVTSTTDTASASTSDDYNEDIEKTKTKIKEQIKRKLQEVEELEKKLRRLEDL